MKGFVPVTKASLLAMVAECRLEIVHQEIIMTDAFINSSIKDEKDRMQTREWFRLFRKPKARFAFNRASVLSYYRESYHLIERDVENCNFILDRLERMATSEYAEEPILLNADDFGRLSYPSRYKWVWGNYFSYAWNP